MRAIITVVGKDRVGIIAGVSTHLAERGVNILDISQTTLQEYFTMIMLVELDGANVALPNLVESLERRGESLGVAIHLQREDVFNAMHQV